MARIVSLLALLACLALQAEDTRRIRVGFAFSTFPEVSIQDARASMGVWSEEVTRNITGIEGVSTNIFASLEELVGAVQRSEIDLAILPTYDYFKNESLMGCEIGFITDQGDSGRLRYLVVASTQSGASSLKGLKGMRLSHARSDNMALLYLNNALLRDSQMEMDRFFSGSEALPKGIQALNSVYFGRTEACIVPEETFKLALTMNPQMAHRLRIIDSSPLLHGGVAVYRKGYPVRIRNLIIEAVNSMRNYPRGRQILNLFRTSGIRPADDSAISETRRLYQDYRRRKGRLL